MGWGCYKHEIDAGSEDWNFAANELFDRKLKEKPATFGRDGQICPKCFDELEYTLSVYVIRLQQLEVTRDNAKYDERRRIINYLRDVEGWTKLHVMGLLEVLDAVDADQSGAQSHG